MKKKRLKIFKILWVMYFIIVLILGVSLNSNGGIKDAFKMMMVAYSFALLLFTFMIKNIFGVLILNRYTRKQIMNSILLNFGLMNIVALVIHFLADRFNLLTDAFRSSNYLVIHGLIGYLFIFMFEIFLVLFMFLILNLKLSEKLSTILIGIILFLTYLFTRYGIIKIDGVLQYLILFGLFVLNIIIGKNVYHVYLNKNFPLVYDNTASSFSNR